MYPFFQRVALATACISFYSSNVVAQRLRYDVHIDPAITYQVIENFGASDSWSCQFVGNWPAPAKNAMADWLFSMDTLSNGSPKGIGLSLWRINIGAGSAEQGDASGIKDEWRRTGSFGHGQGQGEGDGHQQGQEWFLKAARQRGVQQLLGFFNSPPVQLTRNGRAYADSGHSNISPAKYDAFAAYAASVAKHFGLTCLSPVNEPQWSWSDGGQEGCPYTNAEIYGLIKAFNTALQKHHLSTKLLLTESGHLKYLLDDADKPGKGRQIRDFFDPRSPHYIGNLSNAGRTIAAHSYFSTSPFSQAITLRKNIAEKLGALHGPAASASSLQYWQSEYCILGDNAGEINGEKRDTGMTAALYLARVIYSDLVAGNASAWHWWLAISPYDYKDGLIYIDKNKTGGNYTDSKMLWALGNYSRFIRPGMQRIHTEAPLSDSLLVSAYKDDKQTTHKTDKQKRLVVVVVNRGSKPQELTLDIPARGYDTYTTSATQRLEKHTLPVGNITLPPQSIVTITTK